MTKVDIKRLDSITKNDTTATEQINDNFKALQEAIENTLSRDGTTPNFMDADLDMNSYRIINSADPVGDLDIVNKKYVEEKIGAAAEASKTAVNAAAQAASSAQSALVSATNAINTLRNAESTISQATELLTETQAYVDSAKIEINNTKETAIEEVDIKVTDAKADINSTVVTAQADITSVKDTAIDAVEDAVADLNQTVTDAKADINSVKDTAIGAVEAAVADLGQTVTQAKADIDNTKTAAETSITNTVNQGKAEIQGYVDDAEEEVRQIARAEAQEVIDAGKDEIEEYARVVVKPELDALVTSASESAVLASQEASNALNSATSASLSSTQAANSAATAEEWARYAEGKGNPNWGYIGGDIENQADLMLKFDAIDDKIKEIELFKFPNADIIGEPTIQSGQVSGFSTVSYLQFPFIMDLRGNPFQIDFSFTTSTNVQAQQNILDSKFGLALAIKDGKGLMAVSSNGTSWNIGQSIGTMNIESNTTYYARVTWDGLQYKTFLSTNGTDYVQDMTLVGTQSPFPRTMFIGGCNQLETGHEPHPFLGSINLNKAYLSIRGSIVWQGMDDAGLATRADISLSNLDSEGQAKFDAKQDITDNTLTTTDKTIVGAINELNAKPSAPDLDGKSITKNTSDELQTIGVINQNDTTTALKVWSGDEADLPAVKDANTFYATEEMGVSLLDTLYPVGSIYITTNAACPLSTLIAGSTWVLVSSGIVQAGDIPCKGNGMALGLFANDSSDRVLASSGSANLAAYPVNTSRDAGYSYTGSGGFSGKQVGITTDPTKSGIIADTSSLTLAVNIFERTA